MYKAQIKRMIDILVSSILLVILIPIYILVGILIKIDSNGDVLFKHKRLGKDCKAIYVWKFRTMIKDAELIGSNQTKKNDPRITRIGKILRETSIDELPQIINILKGEMSLIGPRPDSYSDTPTDYQKKRARVLPGITGLAQVNGRSDITPEKREKYDIYYIENVSLKLDLQIIIKTLKIVLFKEGTN